ncbi:hypothetical protein HI914_05831 [Erysiphe necator]|nr:hypothetical protein HI914_05831 [Erysiphe necator]
MGLAAPKKKTKLSYDPNNTRWTNDVQSFGHKMLTSQGWKKGELLGAKNAAHAEFHTSANSSHIRVTFKDDNLGLGAKIGTGVGHGECTGLDAFNDLLSRLNGKTKTQIIQKQQARADIRREIYTDKRLGSINFVSGGFLVGDKIQNLMDSDASRKKKLADRDFVLTQSSDKPELRSTVDENIASKKSKKSKKRKRDIVK